MKAEHETTRSRFRLLAAALLVACGGSDAPAGAPSEPSITVSPNPASTTAGGTIAFHAALSTNATQATAVSWSVRENGGGTIGATTGLYQAPSVTGTFTVVATSQADATKSGTASVTVTPGGLSDVDKLRILAPKRIYVQHASVGGIMMGVYVPPAGAPNPAWGVDRICKDNPGAGVSLARNSDTAAAIPVGRIGEMTHGDLNGQPGNKLARFDAKVRAGLGGAMNVAAFKLGYVDFAQQTNFMSTGESIDSWFANTYKPTMDALIAAYPATTFVHITPSPSQLSISYVNGPLWYWRNKLLAAYPTTTFDLYRWLTVTAIGGPQAIGNSGSGNGIPCEAQAWAGPDQHENQAGGDWLAERLLDFLANLP